MTPTAHFSARTRLSHGRKSHFSMLHMIFDMSSLNTPQALPIFSAINFMRRASRASLVGFHYRYGHTSVMMLYFEIMANIRVRMPHGQGKSIALICLSSSLIKRENRGRLFVVLLK